MTKASITRILVDEDGGRVRRSVSSAGSGKARKRKDTAKPILSAVAAEMARPRVAMSARVPAKTR